MQGNVALIILLRTESWNTLIGAHLFSGGESNEKLIKKQNLSDKN